MPYNSISENKIIENPCYAIIAEYVDSVINAVSDVVHSNNYGNRIAYNFNEFKSKSKTLLQNLFIEKGLSLYPIKHFSSLRLLHATEISDLAGFSMESKISDLFSYANGRIDYSFESLVKDFELIIYYSMLYAAFKAPVYENDLIKLPGGELIDLTKTGVFQENPLSVSVDGYLLNLTICDAAAICFNYRPVRESGVWHIFGIN